MRYFVILLLCFLINIPNAFAQSQSFECAVESVLEKAPTDEEGVYVVTIKNAKVIKDTQYGDFCFPPHIEKMTAKVDGENIPVGETVMLTYSYKSEMGEDNKVMTTKSWSYEEPREEDSKE